MLYVVLYKILYDTKYKKMTPRTNVGETTRT